MSVETEKIKSKNYFSIDSISDSEIKDILIDLLKERYNLKDKDIKEIIKKSKEKEIFLPVSIFKNDLSTLEVVIKYLREDYHFNFKKIAFLLNRSYVSNYNTYKRALKKNITIITSESRIKIPVSIFKDKKYSALEALVKFLKEEFQLRYSEIALLLNLDQRTIWTVYKRCRSK